MTCLVYSILSSHRSTYLFQEFKFRKENVHGEIRTFSLDLIIQICRTELDRRSFRYLAAHDWNHIPTNTKNVSSVFSFKEKYYLYLFSQAIRCVGCVNWPNCFSQTLCKAIINHFFWIIFSTFVFIYFYLFYLFLFVFMYFFIFTYLLKNVLDLFSHVYINTNFVFLYILFSLYFILLFFYCYLLLFFLYGK